MNDRSKSLAIVFIPAQLRELTGAVTKLEIEALTVRQVVTALDLQFPGMAARLCKGTELAPGLAVSIDGVVSGRGMLAKIRPESEIHFLPAIGGG